VFLSRGVLIPLVFAGSLALPTLSKLTAQVQFPSPIITNDASQAPVWNNFEADFQVPSYLASDLSSPPDTRMPGGKLSTGFASQPGSSAHLSLMPILVNLSQAQTHAINAQDSEDTNESYHWKALLWQSLAFISTEDAFRLMTDPYMRHLTADKPYWHDYIASLKQWNMRRWWDGDDFLVDYVGHPMEGGVSSFIAIQNSPRYRVLELSSDPEYWKSRFWGMMWATVFSTQQKIGPLGEAALGSDGGYTYPLNCKYPCTTPNARYTNNTGWTDFIATPLIGALWGLGEDALDRFVSDRIQGDNRTAVLPKIIRGSLNPCRTMANAMRRRKPWFRDFQYPDATDQRAANVHFFREENFPSPPSLQISPHFNALSLPVNTATCFACRQITTGAGVEVSYRLGRWFDFDSDLSSQPSASPLPSDRAGGSLLVGTFGFRSGFQTQHYALRAAIRPGFASYDRAYFTSPNAAGPLPETGRITHFATTLSISTDYQVTRRFGLRSSFGNTPIRYRTDYSDQPPGRGTPPYIWFISRNIYATNSNWSYQAGPVLSF
jgi:hypothetical protein